MLNISFHPSAIADISLSQDWYRQENKITADMFTFAVLKAIKNIGNFPYSAPIYFSTIRRIIVHGFPYNIYYQFEKNEIIILAVSHSHRDPLYLNDTLTVRKS